MKMIWRLSQLPTGTDVANLVNAKVITAKEAKEMLFKTEEHEVSEVGTNGIETKYIN